MIRAGELRERITIRRPSRMQNESGGTITTYSDILETFASVDMKTASADVIAQQANLIQPFVFIMRYRTDIEFKIADIIFWRDRTFEIISFDWDILRTKLVIIAKTSNESTSPGTETT